jgi:site-specific recombinase XerD
MQVSIREASEAFLRFKLAGGRQVGTVRSYRSSLRAFAVYADAANVRNVSELTADLLLSYAADPTHAPGTRRQHGICLRSLIRFVRRAGWHIEVAPEDIPLPPPSPKPRVILTAAEVRAILATRRQGKTAPRRHKRDRLLICLLAECGLRANELLTLKLTDVVVRDHQTSACGYVRVRGKGGKERTVGFGDLTRRALTTHVLAWPVRADTEYLFQRRQADGAPMTLAGLRSMLLRRARRAGVTKHIHPHVFRHTFATQMLRSGENLYVTSRALGHSDLRSTQTYLHLSQTDVEEASARASILRERREVWEL